MKKYRTGESMKINFTKMEGIGNDFILLDDRDLYIEKQISYERLSKKLCDRRFGIGGDGLILLLDSDSCDLKFKIFNSDGSEAQMCGNGMRCFAKYVYEKKIVDQDEFKVETLAGTIIPKILFTPKGVINAVRVDMGEPVLENERIPFISRNKRSVLEKLEVDGKLIEITTVSMGNPHAVIFVDLLDKAPVTRLGPRIEADKRFPEKTNVEFVEVISEKEIKMKVWERGAGETLACGTGACASLVAACLAGKTGKIATVHLAGGDLFIEWENQNNHVYKTGPAKTVFEGRIEIS
jgi:diaminopimelate epimerase